MQSKKIVQLLCHGLLCLVLLISCQKSQNTQIENKDQLNVVATIFPPYDFTRQIAKNRANVTMLLSPGMESHSYEPTPQEMIAIEKCDVFIYNGQGTDAWVDQVLASIDSSSITVIKMSEVVELKEEEIIEGMEESGEEDDDEVEYDEHVWTSVRNAQAIVSEISQTLCDLDPENAAFYETQTDSYLADLQKIDDSFTEIVQQAQRNTLVFGDRFPFRYFADDYGLNYYAAFPSCADDSEASASTIAFLIDKIEEEQIPAVCYIELSNEKIADTISESTNTKKLQMHSCHNVTQSDFDAGITYLDLMEKNAEVIKEALN